MGISQKSSHNPKSSAYLCLYKNFSQWINTVREVRKFIKNKKKTVKQDKIVIIWPLNNFKDF